MDIIGDTIEDAHAISAHFPIALLVVSAVLSVAGRLRRSDRLQHTSWMLLTIGTLGAVVASITGLISHFPYETTDLHGVIEIHQMWSFGATALFIVLTVWRWRSRRRGADTGASFVYLIVVLAGVAVLTLSGLTGGDLVFEYGINVRGVNPLLGE